METDDAFESAVQRHDAQVAELGLPIWVGSEPTFTDGEAQTPAWLHAALGDDKELRARALLGTLSRLMPGALVLRSVGRLYPGEKVPRWNLGLLRRRDGEPLWDGPPDPLLAAEPVPAGPPDIAAFASALAEAFASQHWASECVETAEERGEEDAENEGAAVSPVWTVTATVDADTEPLQFVLRTYDDPAEPDAARPTCAAIELPEIGRVDRFLAALPCIQRAALACGLQALVFTGTAPPVDATVELTTVTPDPAVIEINSAPSRTCAEFLWRSQQVYAAAAAHGLSPYRLYFNGQVADSGGAGQVTFGGPTPETSPFVSNLQLLPRLVRYFNRHPALSYRFAHDFVGGSGQSVRPDERGTGAFDDLVLALALLERETVTEPELLWRSLASFLCDAVGNSHRAEINIEKLWNPYLPGRGRLGLVEFRGLRMQHTPQRATAIACLLRAVIALLATRPYALSLIDWGRELHDRFALPFYLQADLDTVLAELEAAGLGLEAPIQAVLRHDAFRFLGRLDLPFGTLELWRGLEFWPLVGDAASPEQSGSSRFVDASTTRIEIRWRPPSAGSAGTQDAGHWQDWAITVDGVTLPLRPERDSQGDLKVFGVRYASFAPRSGLHPVLGSQAPLTLTLGHAEHDVEYAVTLHEWRPDGEAYPGLPADLIEAGERRAARMTVVARERAELAPPGKSVAEANPAPPGLTAYSLDRRYR
ncbi:MAG: transglutaminase family protein [Comamonadaceae bacterium]|nr:transglutaminase family protein [Comamonadaceae bacterium]